MISTVLTTNNDDITLIVQRSFPGDTFRVELVNDLDGHRAAAYFDIGELREFVRAAGLT